MTGKIEFTPAVRRKTRARVALSGPPGSGKTWTALTFAHVFAPGSIAMIDTEKESADSYQGVNGWHWFSYKPASYEPELLTDALAAAAAGGYECVVIDSLSHFWMGTGGMLEQVDNSTKRSRSSSSFSSGWKEMRPVERRMIDALTGYPGHVIVTMRTKTEWVVQDNAQGKAAPRKVGTKPEQREGIEYEFSVVAEMDTDNVLTVSKTRVPTLKRAVVTEPGPEFAVQILDWLNAGGEAAPDLNAYRERALGKHATREDLLGLLAEVRDKHIDRATMQDETGETVTLEAIIIRRGRELSPAPAPEPAAPEPAAQQEKKAGPRKADRSDGTQEDDPYYVRAAPDAFNWSSEDDAKFVTDFTAKLGDTSTAAAIALRRRDLELAKSKLQVTPQTFAELDAMIGKREADMKAAA